MRVLGMFDSVVCYHKRKVRDLIYVVPELQTALLSKGALFLNTLRFNLDSINTILLSLMKKLPSFPNYTLV